MRTRTVLRFVLVVIPTLGLMILWLSILPRQGHAAAAVLYGQTRVSAPMSADPASAGQTGAENEREIHSLPASGSAPTPAPTPDPRWLEIVKGQSGGKALQAQSLTMNLNLSDNIVAGRAPSSAAVELTITDHGVVVQDLSVSPVFDGSGFFYTAYLQSALQPENVAWIAQGGTIISLTVPTLTSLAYPQTDILSGTAPADAGLSAYLFPYADPEQVYTATTTASALGTYEIDWAPGIDLRPQDNGFVLYAQNIHSVASLRFVAPFLRVQSGGSMLFGAAAPDQVVDLTVEDQSGAMLVRLTAYSGSDGYLLVKSCGIDTSIDLLPSYRVIAVAGGQTFSTTVVAITAQADRQAGQVTGQAPAGQPLEIWQYAGPISAGNACIFVNAPIATRIVTATAGGGYAAALPLQAGNYGFALYDTPEGGQVYALFVVPFLNARLGGPFNEYDSWMRLWGQMSQPNAPITVEVQGPSGYLKDWYTLNAMDTGSFVDMVYGGANLLLESGDFITLTTPQGPPVTMLLPVLTAEADPLTNIVSGQAPPYSQLVVEVPTMNGDRQLTVSADAAGNYSADFSALGGFDNQYYFSGSVTWTGPQGYQAARFFEIRPVTQPECPPRLGSAAVGGDSLYIQGDYNCGAFTLRLRAANGHVKFEHNYQGNQVYYNLQDDHGRPVIISTGDRIEIEVTGQPLPTQMPLAAPDPGLTSDAAPGLLTYKVPILTLTLDPHTEQAYGQAPPLSEVRLEFLWEQPWWITATTSAQGTFVFDLTGIIDLDAGSSLQISLPGDPEFVHFSVIPILNTAINSLEVWGKLQPFTPYTITLSNPITATPLITGYADPMGNFPNGPYPAPVGYHGSPGEHVKMVTPGRVWEMVLPTLTANIDAAGGVVSGEAPPGARLALNLNVNYQPTLNTIITATASGTYAVHFPVPPGPLVISGFIIHSTAFDMRTYLNFNTPVWWVNLGFGYVNGTAPVYGGPYTVTLQSYNGQFAQVVTGTLHQNSFSASFERAIQPGDHLRLDTASGKGSEFTVPYVSAVYDFARRVLEGVAPPGGQITAEIPNNEGASMRHVRQSADGSYGVDASDLDPPVGAQGSIAYTDRLGNTVYVTFYNRGYPQFLPVVSFQAAFP